MKLLKPVNLFVFTAFLAGSPAFSQCFDNTSSTITKTDLVSCNDSEWVLDFEDNFDGKTLSSKDWELPFQGVLAGFEFERNGSKTWYANRASAPAIPVSNNITFENGILKMTARKEETPIFGSYIVSWTNPPTRDSSSFQYSSAWIDSKKMFSYGKYEARIKIPKGKGMWPAFWLFNGNKGHNYEIDIFEFWNEYNCVGRYKKNRLSKNPHFTIHGDSINKGSSQCADDQYPCYGNWGNSKTDYSADFHIYTLEWDYYKIIWSIDGAVVHSLYRFSSKNGKPTDCNTIVEGEEYKLNESWPFTDQMLVRFNLGVQYGNNNAPNSDADFPGSMEIDYFRFYKKGPAQK
ncbi:MAG: glycoside hydrolase family 16 protein [Fluviicola sp.]